ncbi:hypothetical protein GUJ93_ZPchr0010g9857 [Zizania palustris]|uniref:GTD-binding domain-containing protein n=1 Tax=Zizania palustris TaxID=103762 RepID=A0A8J5WEC3_ZIZPA|nr:hypothetical protein GUJ93_ZPchr0010g9857 [Zizania palustris]
MAGVEDEGEVAALLEALREQAVAVEELRAELEEERRAAASGADEALAMIVRLQAEKAAERMEAEQFRRVAEERIRHDEDSLAFLKAVVFHQEMDICSLKRRLLAVCGSNDPYAPPAGDGAAAGLPWLRKLAKNAAPSRRNASLPAPRLEELFSEIDAAGSTEPSEEGLGHHPRKNGGDRWPARTISDIGEVITREEWTRLLRSATHQLRRVPSYSDSAGCAAAHATLRSSRRTSPEIISEDEEEEDHSHKTIKNCNCNGHDAIAEFGESVEQIKLAVHNLATEFTTMKEASISKCDSQARMLTEIRAKLDAIQGQHQDGGHGDKRSSPPIQVEISREKSSSSRGGGYSQSQSELLMNHFIEAMMCIP